jgi:hypothetical protein
LHPLESAAFARRTPGTDIKADCPYSTFRLMEKLQPSVAARQLSTMTSDWKWGILCNLNGGPSGE